MSWRHLDGPEITIQVTNGGVAVSAGDPMKYSSDTVIAATDGTEVAGVMHEDGAIDETGLQMDLLVPGSIWEVTCATGTTFNRGVLVYMAASGLVDSGTSTNIAIGRVVNAAVGTGTTVEILILGGRVAHA